MTSQDSSISTDIMQSISKMWERDEFKDFTVEVEDTFIKCHSFLLASCSKFCRGLFRSNMKESREKLLRLPGMTSATFSLILKMLYTGKDVLTNDNVGDIWCACHRLQMTFLVRHCEDYVREHLSLTTFEAAYRVARYLLCDNILRDIYEFMTLNFEAVRKTETFMQMSYGELHEILASSRLVTRSEDLVLYSIYDWVRCGNNLEHNTSDLCTYISSTKVSTGSCVKKRKASLQDKLNSSIESKDPKSNSIESKVPKSISIESKSPKLNITDLSTEATVGSKNNQRVVHLSQLLKATRYCLASTACLVDLYNNELTQSDPVVKDIFFQATSYQLSGRGHGVWPTAAIRRHCDDAAHVGIIYNHNRILALSLEKNKLFRLSSCDPATFYKHLTVFENKLYALTSQRQICRITNRIFLLEDDKWVKVLDIYNSHLDQDAFLLSQGECIYLFSKTWHEIYKFNPKKNPLRLVTVDSKVPGIQYAVGFQGNILIFFTEVKNEVQKNKCLCWDPVHDDWTKADTFDGSVDHMTSFQDETSTYILESGGNLWKVDKDDSTIRFNLLTKLWNFQDKLKGAFLYRKKLFIFGKRPTDGMEEEKKYEPVFDCVERWGTNSEASNLIQFVYPKKLLQKIV